MPGFGLPEHVFLFDHVERGETEKGLLGVPTWAVPTNVRPPMVAWTALQQARGAEIGAPDRSADEAEHQVRTRGGERPQDTGEHEERGEQEDHEAVPVQEEDDLLGVGQKDGGENPGTVQRWDRKQVQDGQQAVQEEELLQEAEGDASITARRQTPEERAGDEGENHVDQGPRYPDDRSAEPAVAEL